jgi:hypothetical protein
MRVNESNQGDSYLNCQTNMILVSDLLQGAKQWPGSQVWLFPTIPILSPGAEINVSGLFSVRLITN